jgi:Spy/CpxP family protein refolding chaperone
MLGFVIGTLCLIGLVKTLRWGRHHRAHGYGYGGCGSSGFHGSCGDDGFAGHGPFGGHHHHHGGFRGGWGPNALLRGLFQTLDTTPGQEKVIVAAIDEVREAGQKARGEGRATRADVAKAMRSPGFDEVLFGEMFARHDSTMEEMRKAAMGAMAKIHDALDEKQRAKLADLIESGPGFFRGPWAA